VAADQVDPGALAVRACNQFFVNYLCFRLFKYCS
jgi:hypothetical protein